jgi:flagellar biosynthesis/type III secretory pathway protein FliH
MIHPIRWIKKKEAERQAKLTAEIMKSANDAAEYIVWEKQHEKEQLIEAVQEALRRDREETRGR